MIRPRIVSGAFWLFGRYGKTCQKRNDALRIVHSLTWPRLCLFSPSHGRDVTLPATPPPGREPLDSKLPYAGTQTRQIATTHDFFLKAEYTLVHPVLSSARKNLETLFWPLVWEERPSGTRNLLRGGPKKIPYRGVGCHTSRQITLLPCFPASMLYKSLHYIALNGSRFGSRGSR